MSQNIFSNINPSATSGNDLATILNDFKDAVASGFSGTARPTNLQAGGYWIDTAMAAGPDFLWKYKMWTGTVDVLVFTLNISTNTILIAGTTGTYTVSQTSADAVGPILALLKKRIATNGQTLVGDVLGEVQFKSTDDLGAAMISARIKAVSNNSTTSSQAGAYLVFEEINTNSGAISEKMRLFDGKLGLGNTAPSTAIHITSLTGFTNERIDDTATGPVSHMKKSRIAGSGQVLSGDSLGKYNFKSTDETGAEIDGAVVIESLATENHSSTAQGSKVTVGIKKTGATTVTEKMSIGDVVNFPEGHQTKNETIGTSGTAASNVKLHRSAAGKVQLVLGNDATAEGSEATALAELSGKHESFTNAGKPAAGNVGRVIWVSDSLRLEYDNGVEWLPIGSGSGGGGATNLIDKGSADEASASIFIPYADAAGTRPIDGTGGAPTVTTSITSVSPLTGTKSYLLTKPASNVQGEGWALPATSLDLSYRARALKISVDYIVNSGTFVAGSSTTDSDIIWSCYDISNSKIVEPSNIKMFSNSSTVSDKFEATVQFDSNCTSFRMMAHVATTSTAAYEIKVDNVTVSPSVYVYGSPVTDWQSWTPTGSWTANTTYAGKKRQVGDSYEYMVKVLLSGAPNATTLIINLPDTIDTTKLTSSTQYASAFESSGNALDAGVGGFAAKVLYYNSTQVVITNAATSTSQAIFTNLVPFTFAATDEINVRFTLPILGKSSSVQMSDSGGDTRVVASRYRISANKTTSAQIDYDTKIYDTHGAVTTGASWKYTAPTSGIYKLSIVQLGTAAIADNLAIFKNGVANLAIGTINTANVNNGSGSLELSAGDYIDVRPNGGTSGTYSSTSSGLFNQISIERISGPSAIAASESVNAVYTTAAGQSIPNAADTIIDFGTAEIDSHGSVTTGAAWKFTSQANAVYEVAAFVQLAGGGGWAVAEEVVVSIFKNGSGLATVGLVAATVVHSTAVPVPCDARQVRLLAGEYIDLRINQNSGAALGLVASALRNWISIKKVGN